MVGSSSSGAGPQAFRWTASTGMVGLGDLPGGTFNSDARGVSADGSVVVGNARARSTRRSRWTAAGGMVPLGTLPGENASLGLAVSADGSVVVGGGGEAWRWTAADGMEPLGDLPGGGS